MRIPWQNSLAVILAALLPAWGQGPALHTPTVYKSPTNAPIIQVPAPVLELQSTFEKIANTIKPAVVSISTVHTEKNPQTQEFFFGDPMEHFFEQFFGNQGPGEAPGRPPHPLRVEGLGSGVIIDPSGLVLTNEHVVHDATEIKVVVYRPNGDKTEYSGHVLGKDLHTDLAVVRIKTGEKLPFVALGDSDQVKVGDWAVAIGSPFGLEQTVTTGAISATRQVLQIEGHTYQGLIQTDAAINRGNSGGPLLNIHGEVIAINTAIYAPTGVFSGVGFAVPINQAKQILNQLIHQGHVVRGWLGIEMATEITPAIAKTFGLPNDKGALVNEVLPKSPAEKAGLQRGDVIVSYNHQAVEGPEQLQNLVTDTPPGTTVPLEVVRHRTRVPLDLRIGERPASAETARAGPTEGAPEEEGQPAKTWQWQGADVSNATPALLNDAGQPSDAKGVIVVSVNAGSNADSAGLMAGDIIGAVNQDATPDLNTFKKVAAKADFKQGVVLDVVRQGHPLYLSYTASGS